jgi:hypothetical protein
VTWSLLHAWVAYYIVRARVDIADKVNAVRRPRRCRTCGPAVGVNILLGLAPRLSLPLLKGSRASAG